jgi:cation transport ATPase
MTIYCHIASSSIYLKRYTGKKIRMKIRWSTATPVIVAVMATFGILGPMVGTK